MVTKLMADHLPVFDDCPRCGAAGLERFETHIYCVGCNYSRILPMEIKWGIPQWALDAIS